MIEVRKPNPIPKMLMTRVTALPGIRYIPSLYALPFEHKGKHYVFHNMTKQCIKGVLPDSARAGEGFDDLIEARFLVPEDLDESAYCAHIAALLRAGMRNKQKASRGPSAGSAGLVYPMRKWGNTKSPLMWAMTTVRFCPA